METFYSVKFDIKKKILTVFMKKADGSLRNPIQINRNISPKKGDPFIPPKKWYDSVLKEIEFQKADELAIKLGRKIPGFN